MLKIEKNKNCNIKINDKTTSILSTKEMFERVGDDEDMKGYLIQRIDTFKEILQKYKEITEDEVGEGI